MKPTTGRLLSLAMLMLVGCCKEKPFIRFDSVSLTAWTGTYSQMQVLSPDSIIEPPAFALQPSLSGSYYSTSWMLHSPFMNTAYAVEPCDNGSKGSKEAVTSISITSSANIDTEFTAGRDISSLFHYRQSVFFAGQPEDTSWKPLDPALLEVLRHGFGQVLWLNRTHVQDTLHTFTVTISLSNGTQFRASTFPIRFHRLAA